MEVPHPKYVSNINYRLLYNNWAQLSSQGALSLHLPTVDRRAPLYFLSHNPS